jgi:hypothetical protein
VTAIGATAVMLLAAAVVRIAVHRESEPDQRASTAPTSVRSPSTVAAPPTTPPAPARGTASPRSGTTVSLVLASAEGVSVVRPAGDPIRISSVPASVAYGVGPDLVAFQEVGEGPVKVWSRGAIRDLPMGPGRPYSRLLDAGAANGVPYALVSEHTRDTAPSNSFEEVVRIGLRDGSRTTILRRPAWETGYGEARLLPSGEVLGLVFSLIYYSLVRLSPSAVPSVRWDTFVGADASFHLLLRDGAPTTVSFDLDRDRGRVPVLTIVRHDIAAGTPGPQATVDVRGLGSGDASALSCRDWLSSIELVCGRRDGSPVAVSSVDGSFRVLPGAKGAVPTTVRPG